MIIVITGATGLVGRHLVRRLNSEGHEIRALVRGSRVPEFAKGYAWSEARAALKDAHGLIHLAGEGVADKRWTAARKQALRDSRIATAQQLAAAVSRPLDFVISASGLGVYGDCGDQSLTEDSPSGHDFLAQLCVEWEAAARTIPARRHMQARFGAVLSLDGGYLGTVVPIFKRLGASRLGRGRHYLSWIHIEDVCDILSRATHDTTMSGPYNLSSPHPVTNAELTQVMAEFLGVVQMPAAPAFALKLMYGELAGVLLSSQRALPARLSQQNYEFKYSEIRPALSQIFSSR